MKKAMKMAVKKAYQVYINPVTDLEVDEITDEIFLMVANAHLEELKKKDKEDDYPEEWLEYLRSKLGGNDEGTSN